MKSEAQQLNLKLAQGGREAELSSHDSAQQIVSLQQANQDLDEKVIKLETELKTLKSVTVKSLEMQLTQHQKAVEDLKESKS